MGQKPSRDKNTQNGCGSGQYLTIQSAVGNMVATAAQESCCNAHDVCFHTCHGKRQECDDAFATCMSNTDGLGEQYAALISTYKTNFIISYYEDQRAYCYCNATQTNAGNSRRRMADPRRKLQNNASTTSSYDGKYCTWKVDGRRRMYANCSNPSDLDL